MKRILIAVTAMLGMSLGSAVAMDEMSEGPKLSFSGSAGLGATFLGEVKDSKTTHMVHDLDEDGNKQAVMEDGEEKMDEDGNPVYKMVSVTKDPAKTQFQSEFDVAIGAEGVTDGGLTFGVSAALEFRNGDAGGLNDPDVYIGGEMWKVTVGSPDPASELAFTLGDIGYDGLGVDDIAEKFTGKHGVGNAGQARVDLTLGAATLAVSVGQTDGKAYQPAKDAKTTSVMVDEVTMVKNGVTVVLEVDEEGKDSKPTTYRLVGGTPYQPSVDGQRYFSLAWWQDGEITAHPDSRKISTQTFTYEESQEDGFEPAKSPDGAAYDAEFMRIYSQGDYKPTITRNDGGTITGVEFAPYIAGFGVSGNRNTGLTISLENWGYDKGNVVKGSTVIWNGDDDEVADGVSDQDRVTLDAFWDYSNAYDLGDDDTVGGNDKNADTPRSIPGSRDATDKVDGVAAVLEIAQEGEGSTPTTYKIKEGTGTPAEFDVKKVERDIILEKAVDEMLATKAKTNWAAGVKAELGPVSFGLGIDSEKKMQASVGGDMDGFGGSIFYGMQDVDMPGTNDDGEAITVTHKLKGMGAEFKATVQDGTTINAVYAKAEMMGRDSDGFGVGVSHDLGGGATVQAGFAQVDDQDKFSAGVAMTF